MSVVVGDHGVWGMLGAVVQYGLHDREEQCVGCDT